MRYYRSAHPDDCSECLDYHSGSLFAFQTTTTMTPHHQHTQHPDKCHGDILVKLLEEKYPPKLRPIGYWLKSFKGSQRNWAALVKEARAVKEAVEHFMVFIKGCPVTLHCDHNLSSAFLKHKHATK